GQRHGSMVNISSTAAYPLPLPAMFQLPDDAPAAALGPEGYGMTQWMVIRQSRVMAQMLGPRNIRVNAVCPGVTMSPAAKAVVPEPIIESLVQTSLLKTTLQPEDMTGIVLFL